MIIKSEFPAIVDLDYTLPNYNTYRPTITCDEERQFWKEMHSYIKDCDYPIIVSNAFWFIEKILEEKGGYAGGGFKYYFWFDTVKDRNVFKEYFIQKVKDYKWMTSDWMYKEN
jgi:hypothetical protein